MFLIRTALKTAGIGADLHVVKDGEKAIHFFDQADADDSLPCPDLVILDINLPKKQGGEVLRHMRECRRCEKALVVVVSTSDSVKDRAEMNGLGANGYFRKPSAYADFMKLGEMVRKILSNP